MPKSNYKILILGAGAGGISVAAKLKKTSTRVRLPSLILLRITIISRFGPSPVLASCQNLIPKKNKWMLFLPELVG